MYLCVSRCLLFFSLLFCGCLFWWLYYVSLFVLSFSYCFCGGVLLADATWFGGGVLRFDLVFYCFCGCVTLLLILHYIVFVVVS